MTIRSHIRPLAEAVWFPGLVFVVHCALSLIFDAYDKISWIDAVVHFLGGFSIACFFDRILRHLDEQGALRLGDRAATLVAVFGLVAFAAIAWELAEFLADSFFDAGAQRSIPNIMKDEFMGLVGGAVYAALAVRRLGHRGDEGSQGA